MRDDAVVLGIETSCDETAAALVRADRRVLSAPLFSQLAEHAPYGGVVPEIAARAHVEKLDLLVVQAMHEAGIDFGDLAGVAATAGFVIVSDRELNDTVDLFRCLKADDGKEVWSGPASAAGTANFKVWHVFRRNGPVADSGSDFWILGQDSRLEPLHEIA